jgi:glycerol-3-phosphate dehydrogenase
MRWITVCGGGNGAHALVGTLLLRDETTHIRLYLPLEDERRRFANALSSHSSFEVRVAGEVHSVASNRIHVTADPKEAALSPIIVMVVPAFAHGAIISQLAPYLTEENTIVS